MEIVIAEKSAIIMEDVVAQLQRQYRVLHTYHSSFWSNAPKTTIQKRLKRILLLEYDDLSRQVISACSGSNKRKDEIYNLQLKFIMHHYDVFKKYIRRHNISSRELDEQILRVQKVIIALRMQNVASDDRYQERILLGQSNLVQMNNKLEVYVRLYCSIQAENKKLRHEIEHLLKERYLFNQDFEKIFSRLNASKICMFDLIDQVTRVYNQREEYHQKSIAIKDKSRADLLDYCEKMQRLQCNKDMQVTLRDFLITKASRRINQNLIKTAAHKLEKRRVSLLNTKLQCSHFLADIKELAGTDNVSDIIRIYIKTEEENLAIVNYIEHLGREMDSIAASIAYYQSKIEEQNQLHKERCNQQEVNLASLQNQLHECITKADEAEEEVTIYNRRLELLYFGIEHLFVKINCQSDALISSLGQNMDEIEDIKNRKSKSMSNGNLIDNERPIVEQKRRSTSTSTTYNEVFVAMRNKITDFSAPLNILPVVFSRSLIAPKNMAKNTLTHVPSRQSQERYLENKSAASTKSRTSTAPPKLSRTNIIKRGTENENILAISCKKAVNMFNVFVYLTSMEERVINLMKRALWYQDRDKLKPRNYIIKRTSPLISHTTFMIDKIITPCPICYENSQINSSQYSVPVMDRQMIERRVKNGCLLQYGDYCTYKRLSLQDLEETDIFRHNVTSCNMAQAYKILAKRFE